MAGFFRSRSDPKPSSQAQASPLSPHVASAFLRAPVELRSSRDKQGTTQVGQQPEAKSRPLRSVDVKQLGPRNLYPHVCLEASVLRIAAVSCPRAKTAQLRAVLWLIKDGGCVVLKCLLATTCCSSVFSRLSFLFLCARVTGCRWWLSHCHMLSVIAGDVALNDSREKDEMSLTWLAKLTVDISALCPRQYCGKVIAGGLR